MASAFQLTEVRGPELEPWIDVLGGLRIAVFREFPYLYEGDLKYEREYLRTYLSCPRSLVVFARDAAGRAVGATTCMPMADETEGFRGPFERAGVPTDDVLYLGESIVLPEFRGGGLGGEFFARRDLAPRDDPDASADVVRPAIRRARVVDQPCHVPPHAAVEIVPRVQLKDVDAIVPAPPPAREPLRLAPLRLRLRPRVRPMARHRTPG